MESTAGTRLLHGDAMLKMLVALLLLPLVAAADEERGPDIYLLIGQSNMAGRAPIAAEDLEVLPRCLLLNAEDRWEGAQQPFNRHSTIRKGLGMQKMGPGYSFAKTLLDADRNLTIGLVVNAKGGSSIRQWTKGERFYEEAVRRARAAAQKGTLRGVLWHQGESDQHDPDYLPKLKQLISDLRKDLGDPRLPVVVGQVHDVDLINRQLARLPEEVPGTACVSSQGLTCLDRWHFDTRSMRLLGERYAAAVLPLQGGGLE